MHEMHDKYGLLKERRSAAYQSEKEISKYKRDYAVAEQKLWEARMQLLDNLYVYSMGSHTVPLTIDNSVPPTPKEEEAGEVEEAQEIEDEGMETELEVSEYLTESKDEKRGRAQQTSDRFPGPSQTNDVVEVREQNSSPIDPSRSSTAFSPAGGRRGSVAGAGTRVMRSLLVGTTKRGLRVVRWGVLTGCQFVEDVSTCSDYAVSTCLKCAGGGLKFIVRQSRARVARKSAPKSSAETKENEPQNQQEHSQGQREHKRGGRKMRKTVIRILWYGLGLTFAYTLNELTRTTKLEKRLRMSDRSLLQTNKSVVRTQRESGTGGAGIQKKKAERTAKSVKPKKKVIQITTGISKMETEKENVKGRV